jgi:RimJ/RimL family protein N-acetyltransferase
MKEDWIYLESKFISMYVRLVGKDVSLIPVEEKWLDELLSFSADPVIWKHLPVEIYTRADMANWYKHTRMEADAGKIIPFLLQHTISKEILGSTRILEWERTHKRAEIGFTWINPKWFGTNINSESKILLLDYAFHTLKLNRVQFRADERNLRSQRAIEKLGAVKEAVLRNYKLRRDGSIGDVILYSITSSEWPALSADLHKKLRMYKNYSESV